jgi:lycopene cyclase domain-containing protein
MGIYLFNLPLEEIMFFFAIPYASIFLYEVLIFKVFTLPIGKKFDHISLVLALIFIIIACLNWTKAYTFSAFLLCGLFIAFLFFRKSNTLIRFYLFYLVLIFPFVIVNGLLTGSFLNRVVVVYNNVENLGLRFMTIPIEDFVFGILLMLININLYEYFKSRY